MQETIQKSGALGLGIGVRELFIDWQGLHSAFQMNMPGVRCFLSLEDGRVIKLPPRDTTMNGTGVDGPYYVPIEPIPSRIQYQWLADFILTIDDEEARVRMEAAINGKGAFRRFKDILLTLPDERRRWFEFRDQMVRRRIIDWVGEQGISPVNEPPWTDEGALQEGHTPVPHNDARDVDALRDFLIDWADKNTETDAGPTPIQLEELARDIAAQFKIRPLHHGETVGS